MPSLQPTTFFHFAQARLGPGSIVEPGNFGRLLERYTPPLPGGQGFGNCWTLCRELIFESMRPAQKPSRMTSCFAIDTREAADRYRQHFDKFGLQVLHEVEIVDVTKPLHRGAYALIDMTDGVPFLEIERFRAQRYWLGSPESGDFEVVTASALRVIRALE